MMDFDEVAGLLAEAEAKIATLEAQLAEAREALARRDAEIAGFVRTCAEPYELEAQEHSIDSAAHWDNIDRMMVTRRIADAIEAGAYKVAARRQNREA